VADSAASLIVQEVLDAEGGDEMPTAKKTVRPTATVEYMHLRARGSTLPKAPVTYSHLRAPAVVAPQVIRPCRLGVPQVLTWEARCLGL